VRIDHLRPMLPHQLRERSLYTPRHERRIGTLQNPRDVDEPVITGLGGRIRSWSRGSAKVPRSTQHGHHNPQVRDLGQRTQPLAHEQAMNRRLRRGIERGKRKYAEHELVALGGPLWDAGLIGARDPSSEVGVRPADGEYDSSESRRPKCRNSGLTPAPGCPNRSTSP